MTRDEIFAKVVEIVQPYVKNEDALAAVADDTHILEGLRSALSNLDAVIALIRAARDAEAARNGLMERFSLDQPQAQAILDMRLQRLVGLERAKIEEEYAEIRASECAPAAQVSRARSRGTLPAISRNWPCAAWAM